LSSDKPDLKNGVPRPSGPLADKSEIYYSKGGKVTHKWDSDLEKWVSVK